MSRFVAATCALALLLPAGTAEAFTIGSGLSNGCHEQISTEAFGRYLSELAPGNRRVRLGRRWRRFVRKVAEGMGHSEMNDTQAFVLTSLLVGVRSPDTHGHSISEIQSLRAIHADPNPMGQYAHSLRGVEDDYDEGNRAAVAGMRRTIREGVAAVLSAADDSAADQLGTAEIYFDFYGVVDVPVYLPAYHFGRVAHTVQDSFAHAIRDEASDLRQIVHVLNYVDAISDDYFERRDGVSHSDGMDSCTDDMRPRVEGATRATLELLEVLVTMHGDPDPAPLDAFLERWFTFRPGCYVPNDMCGNAHWLEVARDGPTGPYLFGRTRPEDDIYDGSRLPEED